MTRRLFRARKRTERVFSTPQGMLTLTLPFLLVSGAQAQTPAAAPPATPQSAPPSNGIIGANTAGLNVLGQNIGKARAGATAGHAASEVIRGNGSRLGYTLLHGNVLTETVSLRVNGSLLKSGADYFLDPDSGSLYFTQTIRPGDSISVYYRYEDGAPAQRASLGMPGLALNFGPSTSVGLAFGSSMGDGTSTSLYGLNLNSKFGGGGLSTYQGLAYFANTTQNSNLKLDGTKPGAKPAAPAPTTLGLDHLITQSLDAKSGLLRAHANFQDVGKNFGGFNALKGGAANDKALLARLTQLEAEKGVKRMGFGFGIGLNPKSTTPDGFSFDFNAIQDGKGSIQQQSIGFQAQKLHINYASHTVGEKFALFKGLQEADKAQWEREKGVRASSLGFALNFGSSKKGAAPGTLNFVNESFKDKSGGLQHNSLALETGAFSLAYASRKADKGFTRLGDLSDAQKTALALETRRQFDPAATAAQVVQKDRDMIAKEAGLSRDFMSARMLLGAAGKSGFLTFNRLELAQADGGAKKDTSAALHRYVFGYTGKTLQFNLLDQSISNRFSRLADLADVERAQFANEHGLRRRQLGLAWQLNKLTKVSLNSLRVGAVEDAIKDALAAAATDTPSQQKAAQAAAAGLRRENLAFETKNITLAANFAATDKDFSRSADLALSDADKRIVETERGYKRSDYAAHFAAIKGLTFDGTMLSASNAADKLSHDTHKFNLQYAINKATGLSYIDDADIASADSKRNGTEHSLFTFNHGFNKGYLFNLVREQSATYSNNVQTVGTVLDALHFETPKDKLNGLSFDAKRLTYADSRYENSTNLNVHVKPTSQLTFSYTRSEIDRGQDPPAETGTETAATTPTPTTATTPLPSEVTDSFDFQFQANKQFAIVGGLTQRDTTDKKDGDTVKIGLQGQPIKDFTVAASFNEIHDRAKNTKDVADVAISNAKPFALGPIKEITITARYASLNDQRKLQNETMTGRASWKLWKNEFLLDYSGLTLPDGTSTTARTYKFTTDPNPKRWFHGSFLYKSRTLANGEEKLIRRFTADVRLAKNTNFVYTYGTLPEDDKGNLTPLTTADIAFKHTWRSSFTSQAFYRLSDNQATKVATSSFGFGIDTVLSKTVKFNLAYSKDINGQAGKFDHSDHLHVALDHQINADHFLTVSAEIRSHDSHSLQDEIQTNLDFRTRF